MVVQTQENPDLYHLFVSSSDQKSTVVLVLQERLAFSDCPSLYDLIIPQDSLLRHINSLIDFSFVYGELVSRYCPDNGRTAESPIHMFRYLPLKTIYDLSGVDMVECSRYDMPFKYFLGIVSEEDMIGTSFLCKFRKLRLKDTDLLNLLINKTITLAIEKDIIKFAPIIVDATHTGSHPSPHFPIEILKLRFKQSRKCLYETDEKIKGVLPEKNSDDVLEHEPTYTQTLIDALRRQETFICIPKIEEKLDLLKETLDDTKGHYIVSEDEDAYVGHKSEEGLFFGYRAHIGVTQERIITATVTTSDEKRDGPQLPASIEQSRKNGIDVQTVIGDSVYSGKDNLEKARDEYFGLVAKLNPSIGRGFRKEKDKFDYNKDAGMFVHLAGHIIIRRAKQGRKNGAWNQAYTYYFDVHKCQCRSEREGCYKPGVRSKTYPAPIKTDEQQQQIEFQQIERFKEKATERYKIGAENVEPKQVYGYDRAQSCGLSCMKMQGAIAIFAANLKGVLRFS